ncbi:MAG: hypothetical protein C9356_11960 [Oleiphilus sp.]|nr:MAG: hypothetical protein C9356_11960 [Oleiphilus sp.]
MEHAIDPWKAYEDKQITESYDAYVSSPHYAGLVEEARAKGYKPAPLWMLLARPAYAAVIYKWKGGCWVRLDYDTGE